VKRRSFLGILVALTASLVGASKPKKPQEDRIITTTCVSGSDLQMLIAGTYQGSHVYTTNAFPGERMCITEIWQDGRKIGCSWEISA
jgi:hypothetical protein